MKNVSHKKIWLTGAVKIHLNTPPIPVIKSQNDAKAEKYCVEIKLRRYPTSEKSDLHKFKISLFDNGESEEFCCSCETSK